MRNRCAALVFAVAWPLLWLRLGHWFYLSIDEGIYLEGARRAASGEVPYRDFFVLTGPGSFWLYGALFHWFGASLATARAMLCCELAGLCGCICWVIARFANTAFAMGCAALFLAMLLTTQYPLYITHRWDSNALMLLALVCVIRKWPLAGGFCAGMAIWITPPTLIVALVLAVGSQSLQLYAAGIAMPSLAAIASLLATGAGPDMFRSLLWDSSNYAAANRLSYGALAGHSPADLVPVLLPPIALLACIATRTRNLSLPAAAALASLVACYPRFGAAQLLFGSAFFVVALGCALASSLPHRGQTWTGAGLFAAAAVAVFAGWPHDAQAHIETPVGALNVSRRHHIMLNDLLSTVRPGDSLFVYPYLPALYFVLGANNPTRYSFLQPGMMGSSDIQSVLRDLKAHPPRWIVWHDFTQDFILKNWPSSDRSRLRYPDIESFFSANYHVVSPDGVQPIGYRLLERNP
jgi:hypothetical protein